MKRNRYQFIRYDDYPTVLDTEQNRVASFRSETKTRWLVDQFNAGHAPPDSFEWETLDTDEKDA